MQSHFQNSSKKKIKIFFEDKEIEVEEGITVAAAVLISHAGYTKVTGKKSKRAPYCQMGICFECMMNIDGKANQQSCMIPVREGMRVYRQVGMTDFTVKQESENAPILEQLNVQAKGEI